MKENLINGRNLSEAWGKAFLKCYDAPNGTIFPAVVSFKVTSEDDDKIENDEIRSALDRLLISKKLNLLDKSSVETVSNTIFPESIWKRCAGKREMLYNEYKLMLPKIKKASPANCHGVYFQRLISYKKRDDSEETCNQLEKVINIWNSGTHRHSALQAGIFDPFLDHSSARQKGFPCLQQIAFHPNGSNGSEGLNLVAFYATQIMFEKAYGNYLGLFRLGRFMAQAMGLKLTNVVCIASDLKMSGGKIKKKDCGSFVETLKTVIKNDE